MKTILFLILLIGGQLIYGQSEKNYEYHGPRSVGFWLLPFLSQQQAEALVGYDIIVMHNEVIYKKSPGIDYLFKKNPKLIMLVYFNQTEYFTPSYENSPWSSQMSLDLQQGNRQLWWLKQPSGQAVVFWTGADGRKSNMMDMRINTPKVNNEAYCEFAARRFAADILAKDTRIAGCETDNAWSNPFWLGQYDQNRGLDFNRDRKADNNEAEIARDWKAGQEKYFQILRQKKGKNFIMIANPGTLDYSQYLDGIILEDFPFLYAGNTVNDGWNQSMENASKSGPYTVLQSRKNNFFFTECSAMLLDNVCLADIQNAIYRIEFKIYLGKPLEKPLGNFMKSKAIYSRRYEAGTVYVSPKTKESWIEDNQGNTLYSKKGQLICEKN